MDKSNIKSYLQQLQKTQEDHKEETKSNGLSEAQKKELLKLGIDPNTVTIQTPEGSSSYYGNGESSKKEKIDFTPEFLKLRGFPALNKETAKEIAENLAYIQSKFNMDLGIGDLENLDSKGTIRSNDEIEQLELIKEFETNPDQVKLDFMITSMPPIGEFKFNRDLLAANKDSFVIGVDTEAGSESESIFIQCFNYSAQRVVMAVEDKKFTWTEFLQEDGTTYIYCTTPNLNDGLLLADIETVLACILISVLNQGHKELKSFMTKLRKKQFPSFNHQMLLDLINDLFETVYGFSNTKYDIEMLQNKHQKAKRVLNVIQSIEPEQIDVSTFKKEDNKIYEDQYTVTLGNASAKYRYTLSTDKKGKRKRGVIKLAPGQKDSRPLTHVVDTIIAAKALQWTEKHPDYGYESSGLLALSQVTNWKKDHLADNAKIFSKDDIPFPVIFNEVTQKYQLRELTDRQKEALIYSIQDTYATVAVLCEATNKITWSSIEEIVHAKIERTLYPFLSKVSSTATIAKHIIFAVLENITGLTRKQIEKNIEKQRLFQQNFEKSFLGAKNEVMLQGLIKSTSKLLLYYPDFASLYPHAAWLMEAMYIYQLSAQNRLHKYAKTDCKEAYKLIELSSGELRSAIKSVPKRFTKEEFPEIIQKLIKFNKNTFRRLTGQINFTTTLKLLLPTRVNVAKNKDSKPKYKRTELFKSGSQFATMPDLVMAIVRYSIENDVSLRYVLRKINVWRAEYYVLDEKEFPSTKYGFEFFTRLYIKREEIKLQMKKIDKTSQEWHKLNSQQMLIKIIINSAYGVSAEGVSMEDHTGILFVPVIASIITAIGRMLISLAELIIDYTGGQKVYIDTDSIPHRTQEHYFDTLCLFFDNVCKLNNEEPNDPIEQMYICYKKAWGYKTKSGRIKFNKAGKAQYDSKRFDDALEYMYGKIFSTKFSEKNLTDFARTAAQIHSVNQFISLDSTRSSYYLSIKPFYQKPSKEVHSFHYQGIKFYFRYDIKKDNYLITNTRNCILGQFGSYVNATTGKSNHKLILWITIPIDIDNFIEYVINTFYVHGSDFFRNNMMNESWGVFYHNILQLASTHKKNGNINPNIILNQYSKWCALSKAYNLHFEKLTKNDRKYPHLKYNRQTSLTDHFDIIQEFKTPLDYINYQASELLPKITKTNIIPTLSKINGVFTNGVVEKSPWERFYQFIKKSLDEFHYSEAFQTPQDFDPVSILEEYGYYWRKLCRTYDLDPIDTANNNGLQLWELIDTYKDLDSRFAEILPKSQSINLLSDTQLYDFTEEFSNIAFEVYEIYLNIFDNYFKDMANYSNTEVLTLIQNRKIAHFQGLEEKLRSLEEVYRKRPHIVKKLADYFALDKSQLQRNIKEHIETHYVTEPQIKDTRAKEFVMKNFHKDLNSRIMTDHQTYTFNIPFGNYQWSNELKANLDSYISKNITNLTIAASKIYWATHQTEKFPCLRMDTGYVAYHENCVDPSCKVNRLIHSKKNDEEKTPTPKVGQTIRIPLNIQIKPQTLKRYNPDFENYELQLLDTQFINPKLLKHLIDNEIIRQSRNEYFIKDYDKYMDWEIKQFDGEWKELKLWGNKIWSVSIEHTDSTDYNSVLNVFILPEKNTYFTFRSISASLSTNPTSYNLMNLELFETSINECLDNEAILTELLTTLFHDTDIHIYTRNASVTIEDTEYKANKEIDTTLTEEELQKQDKNKNYYRQLFYTILIKEMIKRKLHSTTSRFSQLTITYQKNYKNFKRTELETAIGLATTKIIDKYTKNLSSDSKILRQQNKDLQVYPHKASTGVSATNTKLGISVSSYLKNKRWAVSKTGRIANFRHLTDKQLNSILTEELPEGLMRHEVAMFGLERIIQRPDQEILKLVTNYFDNAYEVAVKVLNLNNELFEPLNQIPEFYYNTNYEFNPIPDLDEMPPPDYISL